MSVYHHSVWLSPALFCRSLQQLQVTLMNNLRDRIRGFNQVSESCQRSIGDIELRLVDIMREGIAWHCQVPTILCLIRALTMLRRGVINAMMPPHHLISQVCWEQASRHYCLTECISCECAIFEDVDVSGKYSFFSLRAGDNDLKVHANLSR